jgi:hypothetical protein
MGSVYAGIAALFALRPLLNRRSGPPSPLGITVTIALWVMMLSVARIWQIARTSELSVATDVISLKSQRFLRASEKSRERATSDVQEARARFNYVELRPGQKRGGGGRRQGRPAKSALHAIPMMGFDRDEVLAALRSVGLTIR